MPDQKKPEQKTARSTTRSSGTSRSQSTGGDVISSDVASDRPAEQAAPKQETEAASQGRPLTDIESLQQTATDYFSRISASAGDLTAQARRVYDSSQTLVRSYPGQTIGGAFLAGLVLGLLMRRD